MSVRARINVGSSFKLSNRCRFMPCCHHVSSNPPDERTSEVRTCLASATSSMPSSYSVSMWPCVKVMGTAKACLYPYLAKPSTDMLVCGPSQADGPTWLCHVTRYGVPESQVVHNGLDGRSHLGRLWIAAVGDNRHGQRVRREPYGNSIPLSGG